MNTQDNQGNGWVGGSIGTGMGIVGALPVGIIADRAIHNALVSSKYRERIDKLYDKQVAGLGFHPTRRSDFTEPYIKAVGKIYNMRDAQVNKARAYSKAAYLLSALGVPITAGLLGASLTD